MIAVLLLSALFAGASECRLPPPTLLPGGIFVWEFADDGVFRSHMAPVSDGYKDFADWAAPHRATPARRRLDAIAARLEKVGTPGASELARRIRAVSEGRVGVIDGASCLEAALIGEANYVRPMSRGPYEFAAAVLSRESALRVYMELGEGGSASLIAAKPAILADLKAGWRALAHLHNHPFKDDPRRAALGGMTSPSEEDLRYYLLRDPPYEQAWITNGFETFRARVADLEPFAHK